MKHNALTLFATVAAAALAPTAEAGNDSNFVTENEEPWAPLFWTAIVVVFLLLLLVALRAFNARFGPTAADRDILAPKHLQKKQHLTAPSEDYMPAREHHFLRDTHVTSSRPCSHTVVSCACTRRTNTSIGLRIFPLSSPALPPHAHNLTHTPSPFPQIHRLPTLKVKEEMKMRGKKKMKRNAKEMARVC